MHHHDRTVFPHEPNGKPWGDADHTEQHGPRHDVETGQTIADEPNGGGNRFGCINDCQGRGPSRL